MKHLSRLIAVVLLGSSFSTAWAQNSSLLPSVRDLQIRVGALEAYAQSLAQQLQQLNTPQEVFDPGDGAIDSLTAEVRSLTAQYEQLYFSIDDLKRDIEAMSALPSRLDAIEQRVVELEERPVPAAQPPALAPALGQAPAVVTPGATLLSSQSVVTTTTGLPAPKAVTPAASGVTIQSQTLTAAQLYDQALIDLEARNYQQAQYKFQIFNTNYPTHPLNQNAQYWLGETYYAGQDYESAAYYFSEAYKKDEAGNKAPDALLKLGFSLFALSRASEGCQMLNAVIDRHSNASQSTLDLATQTMQERGC